jgi:hypothetical protein
VRAEARVNVFRQIFSVTLATKYRIQQKVANQFKLDPKNGKKNIYIFQNTMAKKFKIH